MRAPQVWYALDEMTSANGPIWVQNGSHVQGRRAERPSEPAETHKHYVRLQPGEVFANDGAHAKLFQSTTCGLAPQREARRNGEAPWRAVATVPRKEWWRVDGDGRVRPAPQGCWCTAPHRTVGTAADVAYHFGAGLTSQPWSLPDPFHPVRIEHSTADTLWTRSLCGSA